jgi:hypothetical protein
MQNVYRTSSSLPAPPPFSASPAQQPSNVKRMLFERGLSITKERSARAGSQRAAHIAQGEGHSMHGGGSSVPCVTCYTCGELGHIAPDCHS